MADVLGPSDAQTEAAAEALRRCWEQDHPDEQGIWLNDARAALTAAWPLIEADLRAAWRHGHSFCGDRDLCDHKPFDEQEGE